MQVMVDRSGTRISLGVWFRLTAMVGRLPAPGHQKYLCALDQICIQEQIWPQGNTNKRKQLLFL
jgi:hypothetical protein